MSEIRPLITIAEAAQQVGVTPRTIRNWISLGLVPGYRTGPKLLRVDPSELDAMLRRVPTVAS